MLSGRCQAGGGAVRAALACAALVLCSTVFARAQATLPAAEYVDRPVASVQILVEGRPVNDPSLLETIQPKPGAPLSMRDVRQTITHLYSLGRFEAISVEADAVEGGAVALRFVLQPIHTVTKVEFSGQLGLSEGTLRSRMIERFGQTPSATRATDVAATLLQLYQDEGFLSATVKPAAPIIEHDPDRTTLVFDINAVPRTTIARSTITGRPLETPAQIQARLQINPGQPYQPAELRTRLNDFVTSMRHRRHYEAAATVHNLVLTPDRTQVDLTIDVQPGPLVTVQFTGDPLPKEKIADLVPIEREGSLDQDLLEDSALRITDVLKQTGIWNAA